MKPIVQWSTKPNKVTAVRQLVEVLCTLYFEGLTKRELDLLCEIVYVGDVSNEAKKSFMVNNKGVSRSGVENLMSRLTEKGILVNKENIYKYRNGRKLHSIFDTLMSILKGDANKKIIINFDDRQKK